MARRILKPTTLRKVLEDPNLLGTALGGPSWLTWRSMLLAAMGEPLEAEELAVFQKLTQREKAPDHRVKELWVIAGRRGGKTNAMAGLAVYLAGMVDHSGILSPGERGVVPLIAPDKNQAKVALNYAEGIIDASPVLRSLKANKPGKDARTDETLRLTTGIDIEVRSASFRRVRGMTSVAVLADEACFWRSDESANPDTEIIRAIRPSLLTTRGPLVVISSPYARRGEVYTTYERNFGPQGDPLILVAQGTSRDFNPTLPEEDIDRELEKDPESAKAEYLGQFRTDVEAFVTKEAVEACVSVNVFERPSERRNNYIGFVDPSGGSQDAMTLAIAHTEGKTQMLDLIREYRPRFSPEQVTEDFAKVLREYRCTSVYGDKYGGEWPREQFRKNAVNYEVSDRSKSQIYVDVLPLINSGAVDLIDNRRLVAQLVGLERRVARGGRDSIDHAPGMHDDIANAAAGALVFSYKQPGVSNFNRKIEYPDLGVI